MAGQSFPEPIFVSSHFVGPGPSHIRNERAGEFLVIKIIEHNTRVVDQRFQPKNISALVRGVAQFGISERDHTEQSATACREKWKRNFRLKHTHFIAERLTLPVGQNSARYLISDQFI